MVWLNKLKPQHIYQLFFISALLIPMFVFRFYKLGQGEYIPDETTVMSPVKYNNRSWLNMLTSQRKGPVQFIVAEMVSWTGINPDNELIYRLPYAIANCLALVFLCLFVRNLTGSWVTGTASAILFGINGFTLAFGRIIQYQSFNMLFSFLSLWLFSFMLTKPNYLRYGILGGIAWVMSLLSHWDAIFVLPVIVYIFVKVYKDFPHDRDFLLSVAKRVGAVAGALTFITLAVYLKSYFSIEGHQTYFSGRIGFLALTPELLLTKFSTYLFRIRLYNPFWFIELSLILAAIGTLQFKLAKLYLFWFLGILLLFLLFVKLPGTHIYIFFIPLAILGGIAIGTAAKTLGNYLAVPIVIAFLPIYGYFLCQNFFIFLDMSLVYPWEPDQIFSRKTDKYTSQTLSNNIIGFPIRRGWAEAAAILKDDMHSRGRVLPFTTNDSRAIGAYYTGLASREPIDRDFYAIGIKDPFSFVKDYSFPQYPTRKTIGKVYIDNAMSARIYLVTDAKTDAEQKK